MKRAIGLVYGINIGGLSIGITNFVRQRDQVQIELFFRKINENWYPLSFWFCLTDDRGNKYYSDPVANNYCYKVAPYPVGFTWAPDSPARIKIPQIAPIVRFELIPDRTGIPEELKEKIPKTFPINYQRLSPVPDLKFKIKPELIITGKEIMLDKDLSIWFGEPKVIEEIGRVWAVGQPRKTIFVSIPVTLENRDYNPRGMKKSWGFYVRLTSGRIRTSTNPLRASHPRGIEVKPLSKITFEFKSDLAIQWVTSWGAKKGAPLKDDEHVDLIWLEFWTDSGPKIGYLPFSGTYETVFYIRPKWSAKPDEWSWDENGRVLRYSPDKGKTWEKLLTLEKEELFGKASYAMVFNRQHIIVIDHRENIIETTDGGETWKCGKFKSQDGGKTWQEITETNSE